MAIGSSMSRRLGSNPQSFFGALPRPGKTLGGVMVVLFAIWFVFAVLGDTGGTGSRLFDLLAGSTQSILKGQVWRLLTAPLIHQASGANPVMHIATALLGLYFFASTLERHWNGRRLLAFLYGAAVAGFVLQMLIEVVLPESLADRFTQPYWFGAVGAVEAAAIAWALSFKGQRVLFVFAIPMSSFTLLLLVIGFAVLRMLLSGTPPEGLFSAAGAMLFGWLAGGGAPAPLRRWWRLRLSPLLLPGSKPRVSPPRALGRLRVIDGARRDPKSDPPPDKRWLN